MRFFGDGPGIYEFREGSGWRVVEGLLGGGLEFVPARGLRVGGVEDVAEQAFPFEGGALDIAPSDGIGFLGESAQAAGAVDGECLAGAFAEAGTEPTVEIPLVIHMAVDLAGCGGEAVARTVREIGKPWTSADVGQVGDEVIKGVGRIFEGGGDDESLSVLKTAEEAASGGRDG